MYLRYVAFAVYFVWPVLAERLATCSKEFPQSICLPEDYTKSGLPFTEEPNKIGISIDIDEVLRIDDDTKTITFSTYFNAGWKERRLSIQSDFGAPNSTDGMIVPMDLEFMKDLWAPNIIIYNLKTFEVANVLSSLADLWITREKDVLYSQATHITFFCPMKFNMFPFDTQICKFRVGSYYEDSSELDFFTNTFGYSSKDKNSIPLNYDVEILPLRPEDAVLDYGAIGNYTLAGFEMLLTRHVSSYIITYYIPSGMCVIVSWISFLIPMDMIPGRLALLVMIFLVLVNIFNSVSTNTPRADSLTAIEVWMFACILFVFGTLVEYAAILFKNQQYVCGKQNINLKSICTYKYEVQEDKEVTVQEMREEHWRIDKSFLMSFSLLFIVFNIIYWLTFLL